MIARISGAKSWQEQLDSHVSSCAALSGILARQYDAARDMLVSSLATGHKVLACGCGGSCSEAGHLCAELSVRFETDRRALPAIALTDAAALTAAGNDFSFSRIFSRQVEALGMPGDVLVAFSTSGTSPSVIEAIFTARQAGVMTIGVSGRKGMAGGCDIDIICPGDSTARIQEMHAIVVHLLMSGIDEAVPA